MSLMPSVTFGVERTVTYLFNCVHCPGQNLIRTDFVAYIRDPMNTPLGPVKKEWPTTGPKKLGPPARFLTRFHCDLCKTEFDNSISEHLTEELMQTDSLKEEWEKEHRKTGAENG